MNRNRILITCLSVAAIIVLCVVFVFLPDGWNVIPLILIAFALAGSSLLMKAVGCPPGTDPADQMPAAAEEADRPPEAVADPPGDYRLARRMNRAFGPVVAGMIIDFVDFATFGPVGLVLGFPVGGLAGYWMGRALGLDKRVSLGCALAAGVYCTIPGTEIIPLATIIGAFVRFRKPAGEG